jgi:glycosyltransferase involved in cell wall biosynthesis
MHISFVLSSLWLSGGVRVIVEYANRLVERGHAITLVVPAGTVDADIFRELSAQVVICQASVGRPKTAEQICPIDMGRLSWSLAISVPPCDVIIATHTPTTIAVALATHLLKKGKPVWFYQDYFEMFIGRPVEAWLASHALYWFTCALVVSKYSISELQSHSRGKVIWVGEGLSHAELFHPLLSEESQYLGGRRNILFLGDMRPRKGLFDFLQAVTLVHQQLPEAHLWIVSKEECYISSEFSFDYFYRPSRFELARLYASCDVFVSASWWESFGLPPLEAMACGAPVVLTDSRGVREFARPGENCLMVPPRNPQLLAESIINILTDKELAGRLRQNGPPTAAQFRWDQAVERFERAISGLL